MPDDPNKPSQHPEKPGDVQRTGTNDPSVEQWTGAVGTPQPLPADNRAPAPAKPEVPTSAQKAGATPLSPTENQTPRPTATPPKPAEAEAHAAPPKPTGPVPEPWNSPMVDRLRSRFGPGINGALSYLGQSYFVVAQDAAFSLLETLRDEEQFDYLVDVTAVHYPQREKQFDVVWILYSFPKNERIRVKAEIADGEAAPSVVPLWSTANWLERECFDMFGVRFDGHPDLRRILLPDDWKGHPLRKDYGIIQQDQEWVHIHLGIESGQ
jgi:NADH-quinone oxidoreductase subunit C